MKITNIERMRIARQYMAVAHSLIVKETVTLSDIRISIDNAHRALAVLRAIECSLSGIPEPKEGE